MEILAKAMEAGNRSANRPHSEVETFQKHTEGTTKFLNTLKDFNLWRKILWFDEIKMTEFCHKFA